MNKVNGIATGARQALEDLQWGKDDGTGYVHTKFGQVARHRLRDEMNRSAPILSRHGLHAEEAEAKLAEAMAFAYLKENMRIRALDEMAQDMRLIVGGVDARALYLKAVNNGTTPEEFAMEWVRIQQAGGAAGQSPEWEKAERALKGGLS